MQIARSKERTNSFKAHPALIMQAITRQAGNVAKALAELVMNAEDAKSPSIHLTIDSNRFTAVDCGIGFSSEEQIEECFGTLGAPHALDENGYSKDAKFGTFRIGRGQIFGFARTVWDTGTFRMEVDVPTKALDYTLHTGMPETKGCVIKGEFYLPLDRFDLDFNVRELKDTCKWCAIDVHINEQLVSKHPDKGSWDMETPDFYLKLDRPSRGATIYNLGIKVCQLPGHRLGFGGELVTKVPLKLNTARNQILDDCVNWKRIKEAVKVHLDTILDIKQEMTPEEQIAFINRLVSAPDNEQLWKQAGKLKLFEDVSGHTWSPNAMSRATKKFGDGLRQTLLVSFDEANSARGDAMIQRGEALVLTRDALEAFGFDTTAHSEGDFTIQILSKLGVRASYIPCYKLYENLDTTYAVVPAKQWTEKEKVVAHVLWSANYTLVSMFRQYAQKSIKCRTIQIGLSDVAEAWTDGRTHVTIARSVIEKFKHLDYRFWTYLTMLMIHEYCHDDSSATSHGHPPEFYRRYHDVSVHADEFIRKCVSHYVAQLASARGKLPKPVSAMLRTEMDMLFRRSEQALTEECIKQLKAAEAVAGVMPVEV